MYYGNIYGGAIYYGNNDYRDYIAHSKGPWKNHLYKFIDAAGNYIYDTAAKAKRTVDNALGFKARSSMLSNRRAGAQKYSEANTYANSGKTAAANAARYKGDDYFRRAKVSEGRYKGSLAYHVDNAARAVGDRAKKLRTSAMLATKPMRDAAKAGYRAAKTAVGNAYNKIKNSKFGRAIGGLINRGKNFVSGIIEGYRRKKRTKANKSTVESRNTTNRTGQQQKGVAPAGSTYKSKTGIHGA